MLTRSSQGRALGNYLIRYDKALYTTWLDGICCMFFCVAHGFRITEVQCTISKPSDVKLYKSRDFVHDSQYLQVRHRVCETLRIIQVTMIHSTQCKFISCSWSTHLSWAGINRFWLFLFVCTKKHTHWICRRWAQHKRKEAWSLESYLGDSNFRIIDLERLPLFHVWLKQSKRTCATIKRSSRWARRQIFISRRHE